LEEMMRAFLAAVVVAVAIAIAAGVLLSAGQESSQDAFQSMSGSVRLDPYKPN
jgi:Na+(H+)/acetate symporter ActP